MIYMEFYTDSLIFLIFQLVHVKQTYSVSDYAYIIEAIIMFSVSG